MMINLLLKLFKITKFLHHISPEPAVQLSESNQVEFEEPPPSDTIVVDEKNVLPDDQELHERIDREEDRIVDSFVGRKIKALYENGWFVGKINYYNKLLEKYYVFTMFLQFNTLLLPLGYVRINHDLSP